MKPLHFVLQNGLDACLYTSECTTPQANRLIKVLVDRARIRWSSTIKNCYLIEVKLQHEKAYLVYLWTSEKPLTTPEEVIFDLKCNLVSEVNRVNFVAYHKTLYAAYEDMATQIKCALLNGVPVEINALLQD